MLPREQVSKSWWDFTVIEPINVPLHVIIV